MVGSAHERLAWLRLHAWEFTQLSQRSLERDGRVYQVVELADFASGARRTVCFDVTTFVSTTALERPAPGSFTFPLDDAEGVIRRHQPDLRRDDRKLWWEVLDGTVTLKVISMPRLTLDGRHLVERVTLTYSAPWLTGLTRQQAQQLNLAPTLSSFIAADDSRPGRLVSKIDIFSDDQDATASVYSRLLCEESRVIAWHANRMLRGQFDEPPTSSPLSLTTTLAPFEASEFETLRVLAIEQGLFAHREERHIWIEFPWEEGAVSRTFASPGLRARLIAQGRVTSEVIDRMAGRTSQLQIGAIESHPLFGHGLAATLEIPVAPTEGNGAAIVDELNRWEVFTEGQPPMLGTWRLMSGSLAFTSYLPTQYCTDLPNLLQHLYTWFRLRDLRVRKWFDALGASSAAASFYRVAASSNTRHK